ncbi:MAG: (2Fe-2S)-binding protein [Planctomycetes bacterium]|nr:(2Fe-2S)-binding protein [Planctomycetota bacterium]
MPPLPAVVFEHYRAPRNEGPLDPADAIGCVEGRREDSVLRLFLRLDAARAVVEAATFEVEGDRSCRAGLSLVTTLIRGRPLPEVAALTPELIGAEVGLHLENLPMLLPPLEALTAALAALRGEPDPFRRDGRVVCRCLFVREGRIRRAVRERGLRTVEDVQFWTRACTGCRSCRVEVEELIARERRPV